MFMQLLKRRYDNEHGQNTAHLQLQIVSLAFVSGGFVETAKDALDTVAGL